MTAAAEKWISLEPKIARDGRSWRLFVGFVMRSQGSGHVIMKRSID